jgi:hypothetical protein
MKVFQSHSPESPQKTATHNFEKCSTFVQTPKIRPLTPKTKFLLPTLKRVVANSLLHGIEKYKAYGNFLIY